MTVNYSYPLLILSFLVLSLAMPVAAQNTYAECANTIPYKQHEPKISKLGAEFINCAFTEANQLLNSSEKADVIAETAIQLCEAEHKKIRRLLCESNYSKVREEHGNDPYWETAIQQVKFTDQKYVQMLHNDLRSHIIKKRILNE